MPLPPSDCPREPSHLRSIRVRSYRRSDGLWDIEGHLEDTWPEPVPKAGSMLAPGEAMHSMWLRLTVDTEANIVAATAVSDAGPYDAHCTSIAPDYSALVGVSIGRGYRDTIRRLFGRTAGCTHMNELANVMGSAAMQALWDVQMMDPERKPISIDGCHAMKASGPMVAKFFPRWHQPPGEGS